LRDPEHVSVIPKQVSAPLISQYYIELHEKQKFDALCRLIDMESPDLAIIFGRTKRRVDELSEALQKRGYSAEGLHGDLSQNQRDHVMRKFRDGSIDVLVATDVAARGLDVSGVTHVINFDLPQDPESYVHRIGRTGRAGREGSAWTFVTHREIDHLHFIEKLTRHKITRKPVPSLAEAIEGKQRVTAERVIEVMNADNFGEFKGIAIQLLEQYDSVQLIAAALKLMTGEKRDVEVELTPEDPLRAKKRRPDVRSSGRRMPGSYVRDGQGSSSGASRGGYGGGGGYGGRSSSDRGGSSYRGGSGGGSRSSYDRDRGGSREGGERKRSEGGDDRRKPTNGSKEFVNN
jgi:ATP-dependent RNA helicase DeaD